MVLGLAIQEGEPILKMKLFRSKHKVTYPLLSDEPAAVARQYGVQAIPALFVIDPKGKLAAAPGDVEELKRFLKTRVK